MKTQKFKPPEQEQASVAINFLLTLHKKAAKEKIRATAAVRALLEEHPELSRPVVCKSAPYAGINVLTARNIWDAINHG